MPPGINFATGPSQLYFTVEDHIRKAIRDGIPSISHRSLSFESIFQQATDGLRELLQLPDNFSIVFTASATEVWERLLQNCVEQDSFHLVNGAFSQRFYEIAQQLNKNPKQIKVEYGKGFLEQPLIQSTELIGLTHNESSTGVTLPLSIIHSYRETNPEALIAVNVVSSLPYVKLDYSKIDTAFFSVQKGFGLPAGLGVWIVNERCLAKAEHMLSKGLSIGSYHNLLSLVSYAKKNKTLETPNALAIYLLGNVVQDMLRRGLSIIRKETEYKAAILYNTLERHSQIHPYVKQKELQSKTVIVADCNQHFDHVATYLKEKGILPGDGYGSFKNRHLRFGNFPSHSKEQYELLVDTLEQLKF